MAEPTSFIERALTRDDLNHDCNEHLDLRQRKKGNQVAYACQCQCRGRAVGNEVPKKNVLNPVPSFDDKLAGAYEEKLSALLAAELSDHPPREPFLSEKTLAKTEFTERLDLLISEVALKYPNASVPDIFKQYISKSTNNLDYSDQTQWQSEEQLKDWLRSNMIQWCFHIPEL
tara:strand:- start:105 stop:623 length:519 start_codon:yes stop_codon:yes gene_type:complete